MCVSVCVSVSVCVCVQLTCIVYSISIIETEN